MKVEQIKIGRTYRMKGRKQDRRVLDIVTRAATVSGDVADYRMAVVQVAGGSGRRSHEYLPWFAADAIKEVG